LLIQRGEHPFKDCWALPGGFVNVGDGHQDQGEDIEAAAHRELAEETGLPQGSCFLEQLQTFGRAGRDPRMRVVTVAWYALVNPSLAPLVVAGDDAAAARWLSVSEELPEMKLAFDHDEIVAMGTTRLRQGLTSSDLAFELVSESFTVGELQSVYQAILRKPGDVRNFRRRFKRMVDDGVIEKAPGKRYLGKSRPAEVWRFVR
jgi:8-oxo-dGTP diphosphatase